MFESPYRIAVIGGEADLSDNQVRWFYEHLKERVTGVMSLTQGEGRVVLAPFTTATDHWLPRMQRRQYVINGVVQVLPGNVTWSPQSLEAYFNGYDEILCFPPIGRKVTSACIVSVLYRRAQDAVSTRTKFKFIPSWVETHEPTKEAKTKVKKGRNPCLKNSWS